MRFNLQRYLLMASCLAVFLSAGSVWAHPGPAHIHEGPGMLMNHNNPSPFEEPATVETGVFEKDPRSLHCTLNGHDPSQPCPHMQSHSSRQDNVLRIGMDCGGQTGPDGQPVVKTGASFYGIVSPVEDTPCTRQELFPSLHPMLSRSPEEIAPPPRQSAHYY